MEWLNLLLLLLSVVGSELVKGQSHAEVQATLPSATLLWQNEPLNPDSLTNLTQPRPLGSNEVNLTQAASDEASQSPSTVASLPLPFYSPQDDKANKSFTLLTPRAKSFSLRRKLTKLSKSVQSSARTVQQTTRRSLDRRLQLFRSFAFKVTPYATYDNNLPAPIKLLTNICAQGFAFSMSKSVLDWYSVGMGVKVPISPNFPFYDSLIYLPRVVAFVGVSHPFSVRVSLSFSLPVQVFIIAFNRMLLSAQPESRDGDNEKKALTQQTNWPTIPASDSVTRVGFIYSRFVVL